jgi:hypothetical protein
VLVRIVGRLVTTGAPPCGSSHDNPKGASYDKIDINRRCRVLRPDVPGARTKSVDPLIGTWKLNLEKTVWIGSPAPKSMTIAWTGEGQNLAATLDYIDAQGRPGKIAYTAILDGQPHPSVGGPDYDSTAYGGFGGTINLVFFKNGKAVVAAQSRIDSDKQYTYTSEGILANGQPFGRIFV